MGAFSRTRIFLGLKPDPNAIPKHATIGRGTYGVSGKSFYNCSEESPVFIGAFCSIAPGVLFMCQGNHPIETASTFHFQHRRFKTKTLYEYLQTRGPIRIGNDVWIAMRSMVNSGVTIGDGAVVAAGSVVTRDVEPYTVVGGAPAKFIKRRFEPDLAEAMQRIAWWDWPDERLDREKDAFDLPAEEFVARFGKQSSGM
ncbi:MAG: chloramphenicol acetyltransferase [Ahrensia sp.]|nr:chloramphenicol acetyltransferase [Ahrensia sp.]